VDKQQAWEQYHDSFIEFLNEHVIVIPVGFDERARQADADNDTGQ
jgi:hypothetical protein